MCSLVQIAIIDMHRRYKCLKVLRECTITKSDGNFGLSQLKDGRWFDLTVPDNVSAWYETATVLAECGQRFMLRLQVFLSANSLLVGGLVLSIVAQNFTDHGSDTLRMYTQLILTVAIAMLLSVVITMLFGAMGNRELLLHMNVCAENRRVVLSVRAAGRGRVTHP